MAWYDVLYYAYIGVSLVVWIVLTVLIFRRKLKEGSLDTDSIYLDLTDNIIKWVEGAEDAFEQMSSAAGIQTGALKMSQVLTKIKEYCEKNNIVYDAEYWEEKVEEYVGLLNHNEDEESEDVQSTEQDSTPVATTIISYKNK